MKKIFPAGALFLLVLLATIFLLSKSALADGMMIKPDPYADRWDYSGESNQQAFINYENGLQKMILSIGMEGENKNGAVWLFPIPADPNKISIDVFENLPALKGEEISGKAKSSLSGIRDGVQASQIYTIPFILASKLMLSASSSDFGPTSNALGFGNDSGIKSDVSVYQHLEKEGIISEIITAKTANGLYDYLKNKGLKVENGSIPVLNNYIGKDYSFVVSWISPQKREITLQYIKEFLEKNYYIAKNSNSTNEHYKFINTINSLRQKYGSYPVNNRCIPYNEKYPECNDFLQELTQIISNNPSIIESILSKDQKGVFVTFPTKDIYFPLLPTSVYGEKIVPADIRIFGHVSPKIFENIKTYTKVSYYSWNHANFERDLEGFVGKSYAITKAKYETPLTLAENLNYTKIEIKAPSNFLTDDLWISNKAPIKTYYPIFINEHPIIVWIILLTFCSVLAAILAGLIVFRDLRKKPLKLGLIGLSNCLTLLSLLVGTFFTCTKNKDENVDSLLAEIRQRGYFWKRRVVGALFFISLPFMVVGLFWLGLFFIVEFLYNSPLIHTLEEFMIFMVPVLLFALVIFIIFIFKRIKPEDRYLFDQLKAAKYSSWSFQPKDKMKIAFVPLFSVFFLAISWLLIKLIALTV